jgi:hypothetical protein
MGARHMVNRLGCAAAAIVLLVGCARGGGNAAANAPAAAVNVASLAGAPPANASQSDLFPIDNAADNATNTVDPVQAGLLAAKNADCVDQLIKAQPFGESRSEIIDNVTKACLPIATWEAQASPKPPANVEASERSFVTGRVHELVDDANSSPTNSSPTNAVPPDR